jgi:cytochrome b561
VAVAWLLLTSRWVGMLRRIPHDAGFFTWAHVAVGFLALLLGLVYAYTCLRASRWQLYFPWAAGRLRAIGGDLAGLLRGRIPSADGGGLFAALEGLVLAALLATGLTGAAWFATQGTAHALAWRSHHVACAEVFTWLVIAHLVAVALHLVDFVRES